MPYSEHYYTCCSYMNRRVRVQMRNGETFVGVVRNVDSNNLYLEVDAPSNRNQCRISYWGFFGAGAILTLVLFDLLAIALFV